MAINFNRKYIIIVAVALFIIGGTSVAAYYKLFIQTTKSSPSVATDNNNTESSQPSSPEPTPSSQPKSSPSTTPKPTATPATSGTSQPAPSSQPKTLNSIIATINQRLQGYGVTVTLSPTNNAGTYATWSTVSNAELGSVDEFGDYLADEFLKYPKDLVINSGLKTIGIVKDLAVTGTYRSAVPAPSVTSMIYDAPSMVSRGSSSARNVVSHEYWHYLDYKMTGSWGYADSAWSACNPNGFVYGNGGESAYTDPNFFNTFHPQEGFITGYARYAIEEDRAEMFGWLIYSPSTVKNLGDSRINCKINRLTQLAGQLSPAIVF